MTKEVLNGLDLDEDTCCQEVRIEAVLIQILSRSEMNLACVIFASVPDSELLVTKFCSSSVLNFSNALFLTHETIVLEEKTRIQD